MSESEETQQTKDEQLPDEVQQQIDQIEENKEDTQPQQLEQQENNQQFQQGMQQNHNPDKIFGIDDQIQIEIGNPQEKGSGLNKHVVYTIKGKDKNGEFDVQRRYNDFHVLREQLINRWPGLFIPPIPEKSIGGGSAQETVVERNKYLQLFCQEMARISFLFYSEEFNTIFLRSLDLDVAKILKQLSNLPKQSTVEIGAKIKSIFNLQDNLELTNDHTNKINLFMAFLKKTQPQYKQFLTQAKELYNSRKTLQDNLKQTIGFTLFDYEKLVLLDCVPSNKQLIFANPQSNEMTDLIQEVKSYNGNQLDKLQELIISEQKDYEAFLQAFQQKDLLQQKITKANQKLQGEQEDLQKAMQGKLSMQAKITKTTLEEQKAKLESQIEEVNEIEQMNNNLQSKKECEQLQELYTIISVVMANHLVDQYKLERVRQYQEILSQLAQAEVEHHEYSNKLWKSVHAFIQKVQEEQ